MNGAESTRVGGVGEPTKIVDGLLWVRECDEDDRMKFVGNIERR